MSLQEWIGLLCIGLGVIFDFLGCFGLVRFPDVYNRLQAGTKCVTFGTCGILLGILVIKGFSGFGAKALLGIVFLLFTSPVAAHALARGAYFSGVALWKKSVVDQYKKAQN